MSFLPPPSLPPPKRSSKTLTVRLLETRTSAAASKLFRFAATRISYEQCAVVPQEHVLDFLLRLLIDEFLIISHECLGDALPYGVYLRGMSSSLHADTHIDAGEFLTTQQQNGLERLVSQNLRLHQLNGTAIDLDQTSSPLTIGDSHRRLLAAEALDGLHRLRRATALAMVAKEPLLPLLRCFRVSAFGWNGATDGWQ